jgi:hypothetical protein
MSRGSQSLMSPSPPQPCPREQGLSSPWLLHAWATTLLVLAWISSLHGPELDYLHSC